MHWQVASSLPLRHQESPHAAIADCKPHFCFANWLWSGSLNRGLEGNWLEEKRRDLSWFTSCLFLSCWCHLLLLLHPGSSSWKFQKPQLNPVAVIPTLVEPASCLLPEHQLRSAPLLRYQLPEPAPSSVYMLIGSS